MAMQPDDKALVSIAESVRIIRLNALGYQDLAYDPSASLHERIYSLSVQRDGKSLVGGFLFILGGASRRVNMGRIEMSGQMDRPFDDNGEGPNGVVYALATQNDGKVLVGGRFGSCSGIARTNLVRLTTNGLVDTTFDAGLGSNDQIGRIEVEANGNFLVLGGFSDIGGLPRKGLARFFAGPVLQENKAAGNLVILSWPGRFSGYIVQVRSSLRDSWQDLAAPVLVNGRWQVSTSSSSPSKFFRLRQQ
jgi:hypothetical protein